ncbi:MAG: gamma-glutamyl-gamma-aminobutyrate hydrolase family protein [Planctomycetes bacterium]|nr:gamma-glutamyl-gamma-aminobutyrate hydrolase family protein [Planctomycetota bacterium]
MTPIIGITTYGRDKEDQYPLPVQYVESVRRAGAVPLLIPPGETRIDVLLAQFDAIVLAGGGDIDPALYGGQQHEAVYMVDGERDRMEVELAKRLIDCGMPTLAICRGMQLVNVALGGTLHEHLPDVFGGQIKHRLPPREPVPHPVSVQPDSRIAKIMQTTECSPQSWHHQAIREVAPGLEVVATAADGVIEAIELSGHPWLVAVQWHPELSAAEDPEQQRIFDALVNAVGGVSDGDQNV